MAIEAYNGGIFECSKAFLCGAQHEKLTMFEFQENSVTPISLHVQSRY